MIIRPLNASERSALPVNAEFPDANAAVAAQHSASAERMKLAHSASSARNAARMRRQNNSNQKEEFGGGQSINCPPPCKTALFAQLSQTDRCAARNPRAVADIAEMCFTAVIKQTFSKCPTLSYHTPHNTVKQIAILYPQQFFIKIGNLPSRREDVALF